MDSKKIMRKARKCLDYMESQMSLDDWKIYISVTALDEEAVWPMKKKKQSDSCFSQFHLAAIYSIVT